MKYDNVTVVILADRQTDNMNSKKCKLLHEVCGKPMAAYALEAAGEAAGGRPVFAAGENEEILQEAFGDRALYVQRGNDELMPSVVFSKEGCVLLLSADMPLVCTDTLKRMIDTVITRDIGACVVMSDNELEESSPAYCFNTLVLKEAVEKGCSTFSECVEYFADGGYGVEAIYCDECDVVCDRSQLAKVTAKMRSRISEKLMNEGVTLIDPASTYIEAGVKIGMDTVVHPGVTIEGDSEIGEDCVLYPGSRIVDSIIGNGTTVQNSVITQAQVGDNTTIGPYAYLRPKAQVGSGCRVGDFVEVKNAQIKDGAKVSHLTYVGDGEIGEKSNIGCGVVFVNYDGKKKSRTVVGKNAFVGCNVNLVAPVKVGDGAFVAAGTTVTEDVKEDALCIGRSRQKVIEGWAKKWWEK